MSSYRNILVINLMHLGDLMLVTPVLRTLRHNYPAARITLLADEKLADIVQENRHIDECLLIDKKGRDNSLLGILRFARRLRRRKYDLVINLHRNERSSALAALSGGKQIIGYSDDGRNTPLFARFKEALSYDYAYCDRIPRKQSDGSEYLDANPVGLSGFLQFVKPGTRAEAKEVTMLITLGHFFNTKFTSAGSKAIRPFFSTVLPGADADINMTIHFDVATN